MTTSTFNPTKAETFAERLLDLLNSGAIAIAISIGHRTRLFDAMEHLPPSTSQQIAERAGLNERYVREWLGIMVTGRFLEYNQVNQTYYLPPEHSAFLTRSAPCYEDLSLVLAEFLPATLNHSLYPTLEKLSTIALSFSRA